MNSLTVIQKKLCDFLLSSKSKNVDILTLYLKNEFHLDEKQSDVLKHQLNKNFMNYFKKKLKYAGYKKSSFDEKNSSWLDTEFCITFNTIKNEKRGRPKSDDFSESSSFTKRRKLIKIEEMFTAKEIQEAFLRSLSVKERKKVSNAIDSILSNAKVSNDNDCLIPYTAEEALALMEEANLKKHQYHTLHLQAKCRNTDIYPTYSEISKAKEECYPNGVEVTEKGFKIKLQPLLDNTINRLFKDPNICFPDLKDQ